MNEQDISYRIGLIFFFGVALLAVVFFLTGCRGNRGADGYSIQGSQGVPGQSITGPQGPPGAPGTNGTDSTPVTVVQFCPGTPSYPSTFPEVGICLAGSIYAVYSANDGFLTLIPPGQYNSNAVGSACTFTVLENCQIQ